MYIEESKNKKNILSTLPNELIGLKQNEHKGFLCVFYTLIIYNSMKQKSKFDSKKKKKIVGNTSSKNIRTIMTDKIMTDFHQKFIDNNADQVTKV